MEREWKLNPNATKSEVSFFSTSTHEAKHEPHLTIDGVDIPFNGTPKLLGVHLDRQLSFVKHTQEVTKAAASKVKLIAAVANTKYGWSKEELKKLYFTFCSEQAELHGACVATMALSHKRQPPVACPEQISPHHHGHLSKSPVKSPATRRKSRATIHTWNETA